MTTQKPKQQLMKTMQN